jgi:hypothetical protein
MKRGRLDAGRPSASSIAGFGAGRLPPEKSGTGFLDGLRPEEVAPRRRDGERPFQGRPDIRYFTQAFGLG